VLFDLLAPIDAAREHLGQILLHVRENIESQAETEGKNEARSGQDVPKEFRIGYQKYGTLMLLKSRGDLEKRLSPLGGHGQMGGIPLRPAHAGSSQRRQPGFRHHRRNAAGLRPGGVAEAVALADRIVMLERGRIALDLPIALPRSRQRGMPVRRARRPGAGTGARPVRRGRAVPDSAGRRAGCRRARFKPVNSRTSSASLRTARGFQMNPMIRDLPNFGPKSQQMLAKAGFHTLDQIKALGSVETFVAVKSAGCKPSLNLLWALEGLLSNRPWQEVARADRLALLTRLEIAEGKHEP
jgi:DNA transformation protein